MKYLKMKLEEEFGKDCKEVKTLLTHFKKVHYKKGEHLKDQNSEDFLFYISQGIVRLYYINELNPKNEVNLSFIFEENFTADVNSFFGNKNSRIKIQALENVTAYRITKNEYHALTKNFPILEKISINRLLEFNNQLLEKEFIIQKNFSEDSYGNLLSKENLKNRIPLKFLAGYIGIHPNSLSRTRKKFKSAKSILTQ